MAGSNRGGRFCGLLASVFLVLASGCAATDTSISTIVGKQNRIAEANLALTDGDCTAAIELMDPLYESEYSDDQVRMVYASAHGCAAGVNFFEMLDSLIDAPPVGNQMWTTAARLFYSDDLAVLDKRIESARRAQEALMAVKRSGAVVSPVDLINGSGFNPGSLLAPDRTADANLYLFLVTLASLGALQGRYSNPDTTTWARDAAQPLGYQLSRPEGWAKAVYTEGDGCGFASSLLNFLDSVQQLGTDPGGDGGNALLLMGTPLSAVIGSACNFGCRGKVGGTLPDPFGGAINFTSTGCNFTDDDCYGSVSRPCPVLLRDRSSCTGLVSQRASCAAAGIAAFINQDPVLGWP